MDHPSGVLFVLRNGRVTSFGQTPLSEQSHVLSCELNATMPSHTVREHYHVRSRESNQARLGFPESTSVRCGPDYRDMEQPVPKQSLETSAEEHSLYDDARYVIVKAPSIGSALI